MNANKIASGGSAGGALGAAVVYLLGRLHVDLTSEDGALIALGLVAIGAFIVHNGIAGSLRLLWHGQQQPEPTPPPSE